jgi:hypothetical protein
MLWGMGYNGYVLLKCRLYCVIINNIRLADIDPWNDATPIVGLIPLLHFLDHWIGAHLGTFQLHTPPDHLRQPYALGTSKDNNLYTFFTAYFLRTMSLNHNRRPP